MAEECRIDVYILRLSSHTINDSVFMYMPRMINMRNSNSACMHDTSNLEKVRIQFGMPQKILTSQTKMTLCVYIHVQCIYARHIKLGIKMNCLWWNQIKTYDTQSLQGTCVCMYKVAYSNMPTPSAVQSVPL